jgi:hypothetical protein
MQASPVAAAEPSSPRISVIEILAYLGIAGGLYGTFLVLSLQQPSQGMIGAVALGLTIVFLLAAWRWGRTLRTGSAGSGASVGTCPCSRSLRCCRRG